MNILLLIIVGGIAGWIASSVMGSGKSLIGDIFLGIVGGLVGGLIMNLFGEPGVTGLNIYSIIVAVIGAVVLTYIVRLLYRH